MLNKAARLGFAAFVASALLLAGCSGSSSDAASTSDDITTLSGVVFSDARCAHVPVTVTAVDGTVLYQASTDDKGNYTASFPASSSNPPLAVGASCRNADGGADALISLIPPASLTGVKATQTVNLNGLANFLSALVTKSKDPTKLVGEVASGVLTIDAQKQTAASAQLDTMLLQFVSAVGLSAFHPVGTPMSGNEQIIQLLQTVSIKFIPQDDGRQTVQIRLKLASSSEADGQPVFQILNTDLADAARLRDLTTRMLSKHVSAKDLVPAGTSVLIDDLVARMNVCAAESFALGNTSRASFCDPIHVDGDPGNYFNNGRGANQTGGNGSVDDISHTRYSMTLSAPSFEYLRPNGVLGFMVKQDGNFDLPEEMFFEAQVGADGKLGVSGNQYPFEASVIPHAEQRTFLNQPFPTIRPTSSTASPSENYLSTGYRLHIPLQAKAGVPVTKVIVTPPADLLLNMSFTLLPGATEMVLAPQNATDSNTGANAFVRMRTEYVDANNRQRHPALRDDTGQFFIPSDLDDAEISKIVGNTQVWKVEFYVGDSSTPELPQYYHVPARPPTIAELRKATLPALDDASKKQLQGKLIKGEPGVPGLTPLTGPTLTLTAINASKAYLTVQGVRAYPSPKGNFYFRDAVQYQPPKDEYVPPPDPRDPLIKPIFRAAAVQSNKSTNIPCANWLNGDVHCASSDAYLDPAIGNVRMTGVELILPPTNFVEFAHFLSVQQLLP